MVVHRARPPASFVFRADPPGHLVYTSLITVAAEKGRQVKTNKLKRGAAALVVAILSFSLAPSASGGTFEDFDPSLTYGSVEAIPNPAVVDTHPLRSQDLAIREAFVERVLACGYVDRVLDALTETDAISTIDDDTSAFAVGAGGFNGRTTASIVYTVVDAGLTQLPRATSRC